MTLSRTSAYHYWSARYGVLPIIGGRPTFTRNSAGSVGDVRGELYSVIINTPRFSWQTDQSTTANEKRAALLIEQARTNNTPWSIDQTNSVWLKTAITVTPGVADPFGGTNATTLTATSASNSCYQPMSTGSSLVRSNAVWVRRRTGTGVVSLLKADGATYTDITSLLSSAWTRLSPALVAASVNRYIGLSFGTSGDAVDVYNFQQEDGPCRTSDIVNVGAAASSRAADSLSWAFPIVPAPMAIYHKMVDGGQYALAGASQTPRLWSLDLPATSTPRLTAYLGGSAANLLHQNGVGSSSTSVVEGAMSQGDVLETVALVTAAGTWIASSLNGAAVVSSANGGALALSGSPWCGPLSLGGDGSTDAGAGSHLDLRVVKYADLTNTTIGQAMFDELRAFELSPAGDVL